MFTSQGDVQCFEPSIVYSKVMYQVYNYYYVIYLFFYLLIILSYSKGLLGQPSSQEHDQVE